MNTRRFFLAGLCVFIAGCSHQHVDPAPTAKTKPEPLDTPTALAQKSFNYTEEMDRLVKERLGKPRQPKVQWIDTTKSKPTEDHTPAADAQTSAKSPGDPAPHTTETQASIVDKPHVAGSSPQADATPLDAHVARQVAIVESAVRSNKVNDMPPIVPEGEEGVANAVGAATVDTTGESGLASAISKRARDNPTDACAQLDLQMLKFARGEQVPQLDSLAPLGSEDREMLSALMDGLSNFRSSLRAESNQLTSRKVKPLIEMADRLRSSAELSIPTLSLCKRVDGYGVYEPMEPARFQAGREQQVIVYCEVENFASAYNDARKWETKLQQEVVLYTESGMAVWKDKPRAIVDQARNRRHDFYVIKMMKLPSSLTIGRYLLKVSLTDQTAKRVAEATMTVQIVAE